MAYELDIRGLAPHLSIGRILQVFPNNFTASVYIYAGKGVGRTIECACRVIAKNEISRSGIMFLPDIGDEVYVDWSYGPSPIITDHVPQVFPNEKRKEYKTQVTPARSFGGEDRRYSKAGEKPYRFGPTDMMPGDKVIMGKRGNLLGILSGGLSILKGGPLSQIIVSKVRDFVKIISRNLEIYTDFGVFRSINNAGINKVEMLGNINAQKSNRHKESEWDYEVRFGGENLFSMNLAKDKFQFVVNADGEPTLKSAGGFNFQLNQAPNWNLKGNSQYNIDGNQDYYISGNTQTKVDGTATEKVGRKVFVSQGAVNSVIAGPETKNVTRSYRETIRGVLPTDTSTLGYETRIGAGDYLISIGNPLDLGTPSAPLAALGQYGSYQLDTYAGDVKISSNILGDIKFFATLGNFEAQVLTGDIILNTAVGDLDIATLAGDVGLSTLAGNAQLTTLLGDVEVSSGVGNVDIKALAGTITLQAGVSKITLGPAGVKIENAGVELLTVLQSIMNNLISAGTPGYGGPLSTVPLLTKDLATLKTIQGA